MDKQPLLSIILKGLALAMGVAAVVLSILGSSSPNALITVLGIGLFCLALWALQKGQ
jgi:hypothetical protein